MLLTALVVSKSRKRNVETVQRAKSASFLLAAAMKRPTVDKISD